MLIGLVFLVVATREIVASVWLVFAAGIGVGLQAIIASLSHSVTMELAFVVIAAVVLTVAAGRRRSIGRDFDLACVAFVPVVAVKLVATLVLRVAQITPSATLTTGISLVAYGWGAFVLFLAWRQARARSAGGLSLPDDDGAAKRSRPAGRAVLAVAALILSFNSVWVARNYERLRPITPGDVAPLFALPSVDAAGNVTREPVALADMKGDVVLIDFWATWCGPCKKTLPGIERAYRTYKDRGFRVVAVNTDDPVKARKLFDERELTMPLVVDDGLTADRYGVTTIPHLVIVDRQGVVRFVHRGETSHATIDREVGRLVERPAP